MSVDLSKEFRYTLISKKKEPAMRIQTMQQAIEKLFLFYGVDKMTNYERVDLRRMIMDCVKVGYSAGMLSTMRFRDDDGFLVQDNFRVRCVK